MTVQNVIETLALTMFAGESGNQNEVKSGYICDFLSWAMSHAEAGDAWVTVMNNVNVAAVAHLTECACVILAEGVTPDGQLLQKAQEQGIPLLGTDMSAYHLAGKLHEIL